jgi:hypothetical protein
MAHKPLFTESQQAEVASKIDRILSAHSECKCICSYNSTGILGQRCDLETILTAQNVLSSDEPVANTVSSTFSY